MEKTKKILASIVLASLAALPAFANTTQLTLNATVADFLTVQLVKTTGNAVVSHDNTSGGSYESLDFGTIDARGLGAGTLTSTSTLSDGTTPLKRIVLDASNTIYAVTAPPAAVAGAVYYVEGYSVLTNKSGNGTTNLVAKQTTGSADVNAIIGTDTGLPMTATTTFPATSIRSAAEVTTLTLDAARANNTPLAIKAGLLIKNTTTAGAKSAVIEFTGT